MTGQAKMQKPRVIVRNGINSEPLLDTTEAQQIEFYDCDGELIALVGHVFSPHMWYYSDRSDKDWPDVLARTGFLSNVVSAG